MLGTLHLRHASKWAVRRSLIFLIIAGVFATPGHSDEQPLPASATLKRIGRVADDLMKEITPTSVEAVEKLIFEMDAVTGLTEQERHVLKLLKKLIPLARDMVWGAGATREMGTWTVRFGRLSKEGAARFPGTSEGGKFAFATCAAEGEWDLVMRCFEGEDGRAMRAEFYLKGPTPLKSGEKVKFAKNTSNQYFPAEAVAGDDGSLELGSGYIFPGAAKSVTYRFGKDRFVKFDIQNLSEVYRLVTSLPEVEEGEKMEGLPSPLSEKDRETMLREEAQKTLADRKADEAAADAAEREDAAMRKASVEFRDLWVGMRGVSAKRVINRDAFTWLAETDENADIFLGRRIGDTVDPKFAELAVNEAGEAFLWETIHLSLESGRVAEIAIHSREAGVPEFDLILKPWLETMETALAQKFGPPESSVVKQATLQDAKPGFRTSVAQWKTEKMKAELAITESSVKTGQYTASIVYYDPTVRELRKNRSKKVKSGL